MVGGEVHLGEDVEVVLHLGSVGQHEAHAREDVDDFVGHDGQRVARAELDGVGGARQVHLLVARLLGLTLLAQLVDALQCHLLQLVDLHAHGLLLVGSHVTEIVHQGGNLALLAEVLQAELLYFFCVLGTQLLHFFQQFVYLIK